ncbi:phage late control D family protein [Burkholderia cepacia]|nr:phage late control D family protein [Burkholderia cepacia]
MNMNEVAQAIRGGLIQQDRLLKTSIPALPENALVPRRAVTCSELGRDYSVTLDMVSTAGDIELKTLIAQPMTLWIQQANKSYRPLNGYIHTARRLGADGSLSSYQLTFASWMHFLRFRSDMRYWQDKSVDTIITDVFNAHPQAQGQFEFALLKPLPRVRIAARARLTGILSIGCWRRRGCSVSGGRIKTGSRIDSS